MPGTYTKNVVLTGDSNIAGPDYTLVNVNNVTWASGTISSDATSCSFTVSDWTNPPNLSDTRSAEFQIRHWLYNEANPIEDHYDSFTIIQYANNGAVVTTTTTTTIAIVSPPPTTTTTTTQAPTTTTSTTSTTSTTTIAPAIEIELEDLTIPGGNRVDDISFTIQPAIAVDSTFTPISANANPTSPGSIVFFRNLFVDGEFQQANQPDWIESVAVNPYDNGIGTLTISTSDPGAQLLGDFKIRITHPYDGTIFDEVNITKLRIRETITTDVPITTTTTTSPSGGGPGGGGCHLAGTEILMSDGTAKLIEDLVVGDIVTSYGFNGLSQEEEAWTAWSTIENDFIATSATSEIKSIGINQYKSYRKINTSIKNDHIRITYEHPVLVNRSGEIRYMSVKYLELGDKLYYRDESGVIDWIDFVSMETIHTETAFTTYTLDVEVEDSYLANGLVAHNIINEDDVNNGGTDFVDREEKGFQEADNN